MSSGKQYLFIYGSFLLEAAPPQIRNLCTRLHRVAAATVQGTLYDIDGYPALRLEGGDVRVHGEIVSVNSSSVWFRLDTYEGVDRARPQRSLFRRVRTTATAESGERVPCWVYVYNRPLEERGEDVRRVESGCWRTHLFASDDLAIVPC
jgi:gamma-glutamylcyclotransferase (GGCT)/AIG2-like uncharacterized protein YtfP